MKNILQLFVFVFLFQQTAFSAKPFQFALLTDLHISVQKPQNADDLLLAVGDLNQNKRIDFVLVTGDVTDLGDTVSLRISKTILDKLKMPYYITSGNHDTKPVAGGSANFLKIFQQDNFSFIKNEFKFIGFATGKQRANGKAHIGETESTFVNSELKKSGSKIPAFLVTHYPLLEGDVDNATAITDLRHSYNVKAILSGHYHRNALLNYDGIPGIVNRSVQHTNQPAVGYSVYSVGDSLIVSEKQIGQSARVWLSLPLNN